MSDFGSVFEFANQFSLFIFLNYNILRIVQRATKYDILVHPMTFICEININIWLPLLKSFKKYLVILEKLIHCFFELMFLEAVDLWLF